jgi:hypothetical protein
MKRRALYLLGLICFFSISHNYALTANHIVEIKCQPIAVISLTGTSGRNCAWLTVDDTGITTESQELNWTTNLERARITVQTNLKTDEQDYIIQVQASRLNSKGSSEGWVTISQESSNFITGICREIGGCFLQYRAFPKFSEKSGHDEHIITYTIIE